ncbi:AraC family transcriptional regulator [Ciceribacter azotifigens]|uniref:AraC family transcriptional regulator n=1 Tax=Ciceribacter azotifigens TaxID=2069303 RepID=UPI003A89CD79
MDPIANLLAATRVETALYARLDVGAPWGVAFAAGETARFGLVIEGECLFSIAGQTFRLGAGECFVVPHGDGFHLQDQDGSAMKSCAETVRDHIGESVRLGGDGARASIVAGWFRFEPASGKPLLDILPQHLVCRLDVERARTLPAVLDLLNVETQSPSLGSRLVVSRLVDIILIQALRFHAANARQTGWIGAMFDRKIGAALDALHRDVQRDWDVSTLAKICGMSRSAFAAAFREKVGSTPIDYLTEWRMHRAATLLRETRESVSVVAHAVGYESEPSFIRAFAKRMSLSPAAYRAAHREARMVAQPPNASRVLKASDEDIPGVDLLQ